MLRSVSVLVCCVCACGGSRSRPDESVPPPAADEAPPEPPPDPIGLITRSQVLETRVTWTETYDAAVPDAEASRGLAAVPAGATLTVYLGLWCGDSRREVPRLIRALDAAAELCGGELPFDVRYVSVDGAKEAPDGLTSDADLHYVPTLVVERDGHEVGRIVESAPGGVEVELLALLRGEKSGVISGRPDLGPEP